MPIQNSSLTRRSELFKTVGVAILVLGFIGASIVYWSGEKHSETGSRDGPTSDLDRSWKDGSLSSEELKGSSRSIEMNFGKVAVLLVNWLHRWEALKPHQVLAAAIAAIAILLAMACFLIAKRLLSARI
jgi:hypothetical protein